MGWPFLVTLLITGYGYLLGLATTVSPKRAWRTTRTPDALPGQLVTSPAIVALSEGRGSLRVSDADREQAVEVFKAASSRLAGARAE